MDIRRIEENTFDLEIKLKQFRPWRYQVQSQCTLVFQRVIGVGIECRPWIFEPCRRLLCSSTLDSSNVLASSRAHGSFFSPLESHYFLLFLMNKRFHKAQNSNKTTHQIPFQAFTKGQTRKNTKPNCNLTPTQVFCRNNPQKPITSLYKRLKTENKQNQKSKFIYNLATT